MKAKKLIEVAMPIKEISAESVRDKSIRHGHISTLHLWWARRPLPTCRAVVFASLVPDPLDENCPTAFKAALHDLLMKDGLDKVRYAPYPDIPYTPIYDPMEDNLRNRLLMFIGKFSPKCQQNMLAGKSTSPKEQLIDGCLIKWESKNDERVLVKARKLIWVAYNSEKFPEKSYEELSLSFDAAYKSIKDSEEALYAICNRHQLNAEVIALEEVLQKAIEDFQNNMPSVFDPFAGGGAIPLEAARLGCRSYGNDINPVAHIIEKGSAEFPQKYGKPIVFSREAFDEQYGDAGWELLKEKGLTQINSSKVEIPNRLSFDVEYYVKDLLKKTQIEVGWMYPQEDKNKLTIAYYWGRTVHCSNPACNAEVPLLKQFYMADTTSKKVYLQPHIDGNNITFSLNHGRTHENGWCQRGNLTCPCCGAVTPATLVKEQFVRKVAGERLLAIIEEDEKGKSYRLPSTNELKFDIATIDDSGRPTEAMPVTYSQAFPICTWGYKEWGDIYNNRQISFLNSLVSNYHKLHLENSCSDEYATALYSYLAIFIDRTAIINTSVGRWHNKGEKIEHPYSRQAMPMTMDYPEANPFSGKTGSALNQLGWIIRYIESESISPFGSCLLNASSGEKGQFRAKSITAVVTDPPYYDAIGYADASDVFYAWMKKTLGSICPLIFATPQTPKLDECTAITCHHSNSVEQARNHFEKKLLQIFEAIEHQTSDIVSIMFAHQSTAAWTTLCNSILGAHMNIMGSWALDTEMSNRAVGLSGDALESSVTVACRPSTREGFAGFKKVKDAIQYKVSEEVRTLYNLGFRGADLLTACFGKAVSEFGNYEVVEKSDGSEVSVAELLDLARTSAFTALLRDFTGDDYTKFYIGWLQLNGMGNTDYNDATKFTRVGMNVNISDILKVALLIKDEDSRNQHLASYKERGMLTLRNITEDTPLIDKVHMAMKLYQSGETNYLLPFIAKYGSDINNEFWRVVVVLKELLPVTTDDFIQVSGLLQNAESLIKDSKNHRVSIDDGPSLFDNFD